MWLLSLHHCLDSTPVFPFPWQCVESFQSHERLWTGKHSHKDIKKSLHLHKYRHKYMWQTQAPQISFHKSFHTHTHSLCEALDSHSGRHMTQLRMFDLWSTLFRSGKLNNLHGSSSPARTLLPYTHLCLQVILKIPSNDPSSYFEVVSHQLIYRFCRSGS